MNTISVLYVALVFLWSWRVSAKSESFAELPLGKKLENVGNEMLMRCLVLFGCLILLLLPIALITIIAEIFIGTAADNIMDAFILTMCKGIFWGAVFSILLLLQAVLVLNGIIAPISNHAEVVRQIYGGYRYGKLYAILTSMIEKAVVIGSTVLVLSMFVPQVRGYLLLCRDFEAGNLHWASKNGAIQGGNQVFFTEGRIGDVWHIYNGEKKSYDTYSVSGGVAQLSLFLTGGKAKTPCANVDGRLIGLPDDSHVYLRSMDGVSYVTLPCDWRSGYVTEDGYDYEKIYETVEASYTEKLTVEEAATIIGFMEEGVLVGVGWSHPIATFYEERSDGGYFLYYREGIRRELGPYPVDSTRPVLAFGSTALFVGTDGRLRHVSMGTEEIDCIRFYQDVDENYHVTAYEGAVEPPDLEEVTYEERAITAFNYYYSEEEERTRICAFGADGNMFYTFSLGTGDWEFGLTRGNENTGSSAVSSVYLSEEMCISLDEDTDRWYKFKF